MPSHQQTGKLYMVTVEANRPHSISRIPQALKALFHIVLNNAQLNLLIENGTIELTVPATKAKQLKAALMQFTVRLLLRQFGIRITIEPVEAGKP